MRHPGRRPPFVLTASSTADHLVGSFYGRPIDYTAIAHCKNLESLQSLSLAGATSTVDAWRDTLSTLSALHLRSLDLLGATTAAAGLRGLANNDTCATSSSSSGNSSGRVRRYVLLSCVSDCLAPWMNSDTEPSQ